MGRLLKYSCLKPKTKVPCKVKLVYLILVVCKDNVIYFYLYFKTSLKCKVVLTFAIFFHFNYIQEKKVVYGFYKSVSFERAVETCSQLGGQIPLPKNEMDMHDVIGKFNDPKSFEKECRSKVWIPARLSNFT